MINRFKIGTIRILYLKSVYMNHRMSPVMDRRRSSSDKTCSQAPTLSFERDAAIVSSSPRRHVESNFLNEEQFVKKLRFSGMMVAEIHDILLVGQVTECIQASRCRRRFYGHFKTFSLISWWHFRREHLHLLIEIMPLNISSAAWRISMLCLISWACLRVLWTAHGSETCRKFHVHDIFRHINGNHFMNSMNLSDPKESNTFRVEHIVCMHWIWCLQQRESIQWESCQTHNRHATKSIFPTTEENSMHFV